MDETAVSVLGGPHYLYRAVEKRGKSIGSLLRPDRGMHAAQEFFRTAVAANGFRWPTTVNLDGNAASHRALRLLGDEDPKWKPVVGCCCRYLNNIVEQDHRAIKRRCASMLGLKSFRTAAITFAGVELANRIRKGSSHSAWWLTGRLVAETALGSGAGAVSAFRSTAGPHSSRSTDNAPELTGKDSL